MSFSCGGRQGYVSVSKEKLAIFSANGGTSRSFHEGIADGKVSITGFDGKGAFIKRVVIVKNGDIWDNRVTKDGKPNYRIVYGEFEKLGSTIVRFKKGTGRGKHGKAKRFENLFGHEGVCHSWYKNGRLVRQKFFWDNRKKAYDYDAYTSECSIKDWEGNLLYEVKGSLAGRLIDNIRDGHSVFSGNINEWFLTTKPFEVVKDGKMFFKGEVKNRQRVGEWLIDGKEYYYVNGVEIPKKLYNTPDDKLNPLEILKLPNAQTRMALMSKIDPKRIADCGRVIHKEGDMRLYSIKNFDTKILRVRCTTTKAYYYLRVPKDSKRCESARQWTFGVGDYLREPIKFEVET